MPHDDVEPARSILVAIGVAKYRNEALLDIPGMKRRRISFRHTLEDCRLLCDRLQCVCKKGLELSPHDFLKDLIGPM